MNAYMIFKYIDGSEVTENEIFSFTFEKEAYTPYTSLLVNFYPNETDNMRVSEVKFYIDGNLIHHGIIDSFEIRNTFNVKSGILDSRGFSSMLMQNQLAEGMYLNTSVNSLIDSFINIPYITHENRTETDYIYVKYDSSLWDGISALSYKLYNTYPYIRGTNNIMCSQVEEPQNYTYINSKLISYGSEISEKNLISNFHMADLSEQYGSYDFEDTEVTERKIVRHKYFELDKRFLYNPQKALYFRDSYAARGFKRHFCSYEGYRGEDLNDVAEFQNITGRIADIKIKGDISGIFTEVSVYKDKFWS